MRRFYGVAHRLHYESTRARDGSKFDPPPRSGDLLTTHLPNCPPRLLFALPCGEPGEGESLRGETGMVPALSDCTPPRCQWLRCWSNGTDCQE